MWEGLAKVSRFTLRFVTSGCLICLGNALTSVSTGYLSGEGTLCLRRDSMSLPGCWLKTFRQNGVRFASMLLCCAAPEKSGFLSPGMSAGEADLLSPMSGVGAYSYLSEKFCDPLLVDVLSGASLKMELRKESLPLFTFVHGNSSFIESSWRLKGDSSLIVRSLADTIRSYGGEIICRSEVVELVEKGWKAGAGCLFRRAGV